MVLDLLDWGKESSAATKKTAFKSGGYRKEDDLLLKVSKPLAVKPHDIGKENQAVLDKQIANMLDTMYNAKGIGLAGVQVGYMKRLFVLDIADYSDGPQVFINPEIIEFSRDLTENEEGCLSISEIRAKVKRPRTIRVRYLDRNLAPQEEIFSELYAVCIQHEFDHLNGTLFLERISKRSVKRVLKNLAEEGIPPEVYKDFPFAEKAYKA